MAGLGDLAWNGAESGLVAAKPRDRIVEAAGIGVEGLAEHVAGGAGLDDLAGVHDDDAIRHLGDQEEIMADQEQAHGRFALDGSEPIEDLGLDGDIERRGRLIGHEQLGLGCERHGNHHALLHAAGQVVRIVAQAPFGRGDADSMEERDDFGVGVRLGSVEAEGFADLAPDSHDRVEA